MPAKCQRASSHAKSVSPKRRSREGGPFLRHSNPDVRVAKLSRRSSPLIPASEGGRHFLCFEPRCAIVEAAYLVARRREVGRFDVGPRHACTATCAESESGSSMSFAAKPITHVTTWGSRRTLTGVWSGTTMGRAAGRSIIGHGLLLSRLNFRAKPKPCGSNATSSLALVGLSQSATLALVDDGPSQILRHPKRSRLQTVSLFALLMTVMDRSEPSLGWFLAFR